MHIKILNLNIVVKFKFLKNSYYNNNIKTTNGTLYQQLTFKHFGSIEMPQNT